MPMSLVPTQSVVRNVSLNSFRRAVRALLPNASAGQKPVPYSIRRVLFVLRLGGRCDLGNLLTLCRGRSVIHRTGVSNSSLILKPSH